jgi:CBS domain containing-hemolysin-like protein
VTFLFISIAVILVIFGGLLTAIDGALSVLSRSDILDEAEEVKKPGALRRIATDVVGHVTALTFMRVVIETFAAVLITLAVIQLVDYWWQALLIASGIMVAVLFVVVGSSPRGIGVTYSRTIIRLTAPLVRTVRVVLGPIAEGLIVLGRIVTPGSPKGGPLTSEEQLRSLVDEAAHQDVLEAEDRELLHSVFEFGDTIVREIMVARTDMVTVDDDLTLKEVLGFVMLGTVVFLFTFLDKDYFVPTFALLVGIWAACWWVGRSQKTTGTASFGRWLQGAIVTAAVGASAFVVLGPGESVIEWQPFSRARLAELRQRIRGGAL